MQNEQKEDSALAGFGLAVLFNAILMPVVLTLLSYLIMLPVLALYLFIGAVQLVYVIPLTIWYYHTQRKKMAQGLLIGAGITLLINGGCMGFLYL